MHSQKRKQITGAKPRPWQSAWEPLPRPAHAHAGGTGVGRAAVSRKLVKFMDLMSINDEAHGRQDEL